MSVLTTALDLVRDDLPGVGRSALSMAEGRWLKGEPGNLTASRIACWEYLQARNGNSTAIADREDFAMRALICVLYEDEDQSDIGETVGFALDMFAALEVEPESLMAIADGAHPSVDPAP